MIKLTQKQENFCLKYVECGNASEAYRFAYNAEKMKPETVNNKSYELIKNGDITARIDALQTKAAKRNEVTVDSMAQSFDKLTQQAVSAGQFGPAVSALDKKAKLFGLYEKHNKQRSPDPIGNLLKFIDGRSRGLPESNQQVTRKSNE